MKIRYSKKRLFSNLVLGVFFAFFGIIKTLDGSADYFNYFQLVLGVLMLVTYYFERRNQYLKIEKGYLTKNSLKRKILQLDKIEQVQSFPGRIKIYTSHKSLNINTSIINDDSLKDLYRALGSLELDPQENPFIGWSQTHS